MVIALVVITTSLFLCVNRALQAYKTGSSLLSKSFRKFTYVNAKSQGNLDITWKYKLEKFSKKVYQLRVTF